MTEKNVSTNTITKPQILTYIPQNVDQSLQNILVMGLGQKKCMQSLCSFVS